MAKAAASQFNSGKAEIRRVPYVNDVEHIVQVLEEVAQHRAIVAFTLVVPQLRDCLVKKAAEVGVVTVDLLGPMMDAISKFSHSSPRYEPGLIHKMDEEYFKKVDAIEFAVKYDDGKDPRGIVNADIVLIGVSRTSKTPLCMYLAHKRIRAANIPLVPEVAPPEELFQLSPGKVIGLTVKPEVLNPIRKERLLSLGLAPDADYASNERILKEIEYAEEVMTKLRCPVIDVTNRAIEENAGRILQIYYRGEYGAKK